MDKGPKGAYEALEILENKDIFEPSIISKWLNPVSASALTLISSIGANYLTRRPILSAVQRHAILTVGVFFLIKYLDVKHEERLAERDAGLREYVRLHSEEFPPLEKKKYKYVLEQWYPVRT